MLQVEAREGVVGFLPQLLKELGTHSVEVGTGGGKGLVGLFVLINDISDLPL
jgi:hypothetical protein